MRRPCSICHTADECRVHVVPGEELRVDAVVRASPDGMTQRQVAEIYGCTHQRIDQIEARALAKFVAGLAEAMATDAKDRAAAAANRRRVRNLTWYQSVEFLRGALSSRDADAAMPISRHIADDWEPGGALVSCAGDVDGTG